MEELKIASPQVLLDKCLGLFLSDQYWICPAGRKTAWGGGNFFDNAFSEDVGNALLGHPVSGEGVSLMSPDNTSDGWLNLNALAGIDEELQELTKGSLFIDEARTQALCKGLCGRVDRLTEVMNSRRSLYPVDDRAADVQEDAAYSGKDMEW